jgi:hypothetical protein
MHRMAQKFDRHRFDRRRKSHRKLIRNFDQFHRHRNLTGTESRPTPIALRRSDEKSMLSSPDRCYRGSRVGPRSVCRRQSGIGDSTRFDICHATLTSFHEYPHRIRKHSHLIEMGQASIATASKFLRLSVIIGYQSSHRMQGSSLETWKPYSTIFLRLVSTRQFSMFVFSDGLWHIRSV